MMEIAQGEDTLRGYVERFIEALITITDVEPKITLYAFEKSMKAKSLLSVDLRVNEVLTIETRMTKAKKFTEIRRKKTQRLKVKYQISM